MSANSIFDGPITNLLSVLCILIEILSGAHTTEKKSRNGFKFGTFVGCFPSDGATSMAVKGLSLLTIQLHVTCTSEMVWVSVFFQQVDETTGRMTGTYKTYAICGAIRRMVCFCLFLE